MQSLFQRLRALFSFVPGVHAQARPADLPEHEPSSNEPAYLAIARGEIGQAEIPGPANNLRILSYYAKAGFPGINDETTPWCAGFVNFCLESAGVPGSKSLEAREFLNWGKPVTKPYPGCVAVFWRDSPQSWHGHTGFYVGETAAGIQLLAGNQGDKVCIEPQSKMKLLGYREPIKASNSRTLKAQTVGLIGDSLTAASIGGKVVESLPDALALGTSVQSLAAYWPWFGVIGITIGIIARMVTIYARVSDLSEKGR